MSHDDLQLWETVADDGQKIVVTSLEAQAVKAWAEAMITMFPGNNPSEPNDCVQWMVGFLGGVMTASDEDTAKIIAAGRRIQISHGDRPAMATPLTPDDAAEMAKTSKAPQAKRFRRW